MRQEKPVNVWTEMRITDLGVSITLYSEWPSHPVTKVEDEVWLTQSELSETGEVRNDLKLSESTREAISRESGPSMEGTVLDPQAVRDFEEEVFNPESAFDIPSVGDVLLDTERNPKYGNGHVEITEVGLGPAHEVEIEKHGVETTIAALNSSHPSSAPVVKAQYVDGSDKEYCFPVTRLTEL